MNSRKKTFILWVFAFAGLVVFQNCKGPMKAASDVDSRSISSQEDHVDSSSKNQHIVKTDFSRSQAIELYRRLAGVTPQLDDPAIGEMQTLLLQGQAHAAAEVATQSFGFYNITVRDFAVKMSNVEQTVQAPLNDLAATVIGSVRDGISAISLLTENYYYKASGLSGVPENKINDIIKSNNHYQAIEDGGYDLSAVLEKVNGQQVINQAGSAVGLTDAAGILTSRAFMEAHAKAGTNRRIIEYSFKVFMCKSIDEWASSSNPDNRVGRDIGRFPQSDYLGKCKACHTGMDALRPATAYFDFDDGFIKYKYNYTMDPNPDNPAQLNIPVPFDEQNISYKFRRSSETFPDGYTVTSDQWQNYADSRDFGFRTSNSGQGMNKLGELIAYSEQFSRCMSKRVFRSVCRREVGEDESYLIQDMADRFENNGYDLKKLFIDVAVQPQCVGLEL